MDGEMSVGDGDAAEPAPGVEAQTDADQNDALMTLLDPIFFPVADEVEVKRINSFRAKYQEFRQGNPFGAKGEIIKTAAADKKPESNTQAWVQPPFITKLRNMVDFAGNNRYVRWNEAGDAILVESLQEFANEVLPKYFKHSNFPSFLRQLNMYHFSTTRQGQDWREFRNPHFQRGRADLQQLIKRRPASSSSSARNAAAKRREAASAAALAAKQSTELAAGFKLGIAHDLAALHTALLGSRAQCQDIAAHVVQLTRLVRAQEARLRYLEQGHSTSSTIRRSPMETEAGGTNAASAAADPSDFAAATVPVPLFSNLPPLPAIRTTEVAAVSAANSRIAAEAMKFKLESKRGSKRASSNELVHSRRSNAVGTAVRRKLENAQYVRAGTRNSPAVAQNASPALAMPVMPLYPADNPAPTFGGSYGGIMPFGPVDDMGFDAGATTHLEGYWP